MNFKKHCDISQKGVDKSRISMKIYRFISKYISYLFVKLRITPNVVTVSHNIMEFMALFLLLTGDYALFYVTIIVLVVGGILDNVDGEIARVTGNMSMRGEYLDLLGHRTIHPLFFLFLSIGVYMNTNEISVLIAGAISGVAYTISEVASNVYKQMLYDKEKRSDIVRKVKIKHHIFSIRWWEYSLFCFDHIKLFLVISLFFGKPEYIIYIYTPLFILRALFATRDKYILL